MQEASADSLTGRALRPELPPAATRWTSPSGPRASMSSMRVRAAGDNSFLSRNTPDIPLVRDGRSLHVLFEVALSIQARSANE